ncbi:MAG: hypothetical protein ACJZ4R_00885 [Candidatus Pelagibacter sp.]
MNYQGGFVRRGLPGEFLYQIHQFLGIKLDLLVLLTVCTIYFYISFFLYKSIKYIQSSYINILIFLSPGFFLYPVMNSEVIGRKDLLFCFILGYFIFFEKKLNDRFLFLFTILAIIFLGLSHSVFLFYSPYLVFLFFLIKSNRNIKIKTYEIFSFPICILAIFLLIFFNQGNETIVYEICNSVKGYVSSECSNEGQMYWLGNNVKSHLMAQSIKINHFKIYLISLVAVFLFISIKFYNSKFKIKYLNLQKVNPLFILILLFFLTIPAYYLGSDWGRYISLSYTGSFFLYIYCIKENLISSNYDLKINNFFFSVLIIFYSFLWTFPFYHAEKIKITIKKPLLQIIEFK